MTTSYLPSPALLTSLTALGRHAVSVPSLAALADGGGLELDTCVPLELARAREHAASMLPRVATEATRARMVESLALPADDARGLLYALSCGCTEGAPGEAASLRLHHELLAQLESTKSEYNARSEMESYTAELKVAIKTDIARLISAVQNLETNEAALEAAKHEPAYLTEATQWESVHSVWQAVQQAMNAAEGLTSVQPADAQRVQAASRLTAAIQAATVKMEAPADLSVPAAPSSDAAAAFDVQLLASMATLLQHQLQSLAEWNARNTDLSASIAAAQKGAPRIASFASAQAEAQAAGAAVSDLDRPLKSVRTATTILSKLSGLTLLQQLDVEHTDEESGGMPCMATQMLVAVRGQPTVIATGNDEEMYASEANFARIIAAQQAAEPDYIVLQVLLLTPAQIAEVEALRAGPATVASIAPASPTAASELSSSRVLRVDVLGSLRACQLPSLVDSGAQGQRSPEEVQRALETTLIPCPEANAAGVARATRRALDQQRKYGRGALDSLMRDIAFGQ